MPETDPDDVLIATTVYRRGAMIERRRAVALARHFREAEGLSNAQIADRLGRSCGRTLWVVVPGAM